MRIRRVDKNQSRLVEQIRGIPGTTITHLHTLGKGNGDILVGYRNHNYLFELKNPDLSPSRRKLTPDEKEFHAKWTGQIAVVETLQDVLNIILK